MSDPTRTDPDSDAPDSSETDAATDSATDAPSADAAEAESAPATPGSAAGPDTLDTGDLTADLDPEARAEVERKAADYARELADEYRRDADRPLIRRKRNRFLQQLVDRELADEARDIDEVRSEESFVITTNLVLSMASVALFVLVSRLAGDRFEHYLGKTAEFFSVNLGWFYILLSGCALIFLLYLALSRFGSVVLGEPDQEPEFDDLSWYSMLFSAGMGVGLLFNGAGEPIQHFVSPPGGEGAAQTAEAARRAMEITIFHWGLNAWAIYLLCAVGVAYYGFRKSKKYLVSSSIVDVTASPRARSALKVTTDLVSTLAVTFGVAASLGMGVMQFAGGLFQVYGMDVRDPTGYAAILGVVTVLFILSASTGLDKGIKILSNLNMGIAVLLMLFVTAVGPTSFILKVFVDTLGSYLAALVRLSFKLAPFTPQYEAWMQSWTLPYFTWWIAWSPFVGIFIARISKGRTIRELVFGGLLVPSIFTIFWFSTFGGAALHLEVFQKVGEAGIAHALAQDPGRITESCFMVLDAFPLSFWTSTTAMFLILTFLVTSADSACFVISMMTTEGDLEPSTGVKVAWGLVLAVLTLILIQSGGQQGIDTIKAAVVVCAFPFSVVMLLMAVSVTVRLSMQVERERI